MIRCRASAAGRWSKCAMSARIIPTLPVEPDSDEAREGTCAAWVADVVLRGDAHSAEDMSGETHANGWMVTPDMVAHVQGYIDFIKARGGDLHTEQSITLGPYIAGTLDAAAPVVANGILYIDDFKYGMMIVEAERNPQCGCYGGGLFYSLPPEIQAAIHTIQIGIYQPRAFHPDGIYRTWTITPAELYDFSMELMAAAERAQDPNSLATPGAHCRNTRCEAASGCAALSHSLYAAFSAVQSTGHRTMTPQELSNELTFLHLAEKMLKAKKSAVDAEALERSKTEYLPGWGMKARYGKRKIISHPLTVKNLTGVDPFEPKLRTPKDMEENGGVHPNVMKGFTETPIIGYKLQPISQEEIKRMFKKDTK